MSPTLKSGTYVIVNKKSGTAFDLSGQDKRSIIGFTKHGRENQKVRTKATRQLPTVIVDRLIPISS